MRKVIALLALFWSSCLYAGDGECFLKERVDISEVYAPIVIDDGVRRRNYVILNVPVSCRSGKGKVPSSYDEAVVLLDKALPLDLKVGLVSGGYANPYGSTSYGASVLTDISAYLRKKWQLDRRSGVCKAVDEISLREQGGCFYLLIDSLKGMYRKDI